MGTIQVMVMLVTALISIGIPKTAHGKLKLCSTNDINDTKMKAELDEDCVSLNRNDTSCKEVTATKCGTCAKDDSMVIQCDNTIVFKCPVPERIVCSLSQSNCTNCECICKPLGNDSSDSPVPATSIPTTSNNGTSGSTTVPATSIATTSNNGTSGSPTVPATSIDTTSNNGTSGSPTVPATSIATTSNNGTYGSPTVLATSIATTSNNGTSGSTTVPVTATTNPNIGTSISTVSTTTSRLTTLNSPANLTKNALVSVNNLQSIIIGLSVCSIVLIMTVLVTGVLLWKRCRTPKSAPSTLITPSNVGVNITDLITSTPLPRENNYDQIVIENIPDSVYTQLAKISENKSTTESNTAEKLEVTDNYNRTSNIRQDYMKLREVTRDMNTDYHKLTNNNIPIESDNPSDLRKIDDGSAVVLEDYQKPNLDSVYFELEKSDGMYDKSFKKPDDTRMSFNPKENLVVFSNLSKMNTDAESNLPAPLNATSCNTSSLQFRNDISTYFELEKLGENDSEDQSEPVSTNQYSKLREVTRDFLHDYNEFSLLYVSPEHGQTNTS